MPIQALIFDVDGTIAETDELHRIAWNAAFASCGIAWHWTRAIYSQLRPLTDGATRLHAFSQQSHAALSRLGDGDTQRRLLSEKTRAYAELLRQGAARPRPGIIRLMAEARAAHVPIAAASTGSRIDFDLLIFHTIGFDALGWFDSVRTRDDCPAGQSPYGAVIDAMGLMPHSCLAIDDAACGIASAKAAGLCALATPGLYTSSHRFDSTTLVLSDLGQPQTPFQVIQGDARGHSYVTLSALHNWANQAAHAA